MNRRTTAGPTKGERTRARVLDAAEICFAERGFEAASLREIARESGIQEPGLYNYFKGKEELYAAVLERALSPMTTALEAHLERGERPDFQSLPAQMTDLLCEHPRMASLFHHALRGDPESPGVRQVRRWLDRLFDQGVEAARGAGIAEIDRSDLAIRIIAMFNLCTGYFLAQRAFETMAEGQLIDPDNVERQKRLLAEIAKTVMPSGR